MINWKALLRPPLPQRVLIFSWKCLRNDISVRTIVKSKNSTLDDKCRILGKVQDSIAMLLCTVSLLEQVGLACNGAFFFIIILNQ